MRARQFDLPDFPSTQHLPRVLNPDAITRLDKVADEAEADIIFQARRAEFSEKVDGANCGILAFPDAHGAHGEVVMVRNRSHVLQKGYTSRKTAAQSQFSSVWGWIYEHRDQFESLARMIRGAVYGEWMHFAHGMRYTALPSKFIAHSLWDMDGQFWVDPDAARDMLTTTGFEMPQKLDRPQDYEELIKLATAPSRWADEAREGIYIKVGDGKQTTHRFKIVRPGFRPGALFGSGQKNVIEKR